MIPEPFTFLLSAILVVNHSTATLYRKRMQKASDTNIPTYIRLMEMMRHVSLDPTLCGFHKADTRILKGTLTREAMSSELRAKFYCCTR